MIEQVPRTQPEATANFPRGCFPDSTGLHCSTHQRPMSECIIAMRLKSVQVRVYEEESGR